MELTSASVGAFGIVHPSEVPNEYISIWSLISPDHLTVDKERGMERGDNAIGSKLFFTSFCGEPEIL